MSSQERGFKQGTHNRGAKINGEQVMQIRELYARGWTQSRLCKEFGLGIAQIGKIVRGESWKNLPTIRTDAELSVMTAMSNYRTAETLSPERMRESQERMMRLVAEGDAPRGPPLPQRADDEPTGEGLSKLNAVAAQALAIPLASEFKCSHPGCEERFPTSVLLAEHSLGHL